MLSSSLYRLVSRAEMLQEDGHTDQTSVHCVGPGHGDTVESYIYILVDTVDICRYLVRADLAVCTALLMAPVSTPPRPPGITVQYARLEMGSDVTHNKYQPHLSSTTSPAGRNPASQRGWCSSAARSEVRPAVSSAVEAETGRLV